MEQKKSKDNQIVETIQENRYKDLDVTTKETMEIKVPEKNQKVVITITKRTFYDPIKEKIITDQTVHRARYRIGSSKGKKQKNN